MITKSKQKVVIIGHGSTSRLGIVRAVAEIGCDISVIVMCWHRHSSSQLDTRKPYDCYSKYVSSVYYCFAEDGEGLIRLLLQKCSDPFQKVILLPDSDFSAVTIDDNQSVLSPFFLFPSIRRTPGAIRYWMNKDVQKELARKIGLHVANSTVLEVKNGAFSIPKGVSYPCFTKALVTISGGKHLFKRCNNAVELQSHLEAISKKQDLKVLIEDYKDIETEYALLGFSNGNDIIIPGIIKFLTNTSSHFGIAMTGMVMPIIGFEEIIDKFKAFVREIGFCGVFDIDFYSSEGQLYFGELNLRFGGSGYAITKMGVNLPAMLVKHFRGEDYSEMKAAIDRTSNYVNERMCEDDWYRGYLTNREYHRRINTADICFISDKKDPRPKLCYNLVHFARSFKKVFSH